MPDLVLAAQLTAATVGGACAGFMVASLDNATKREDEAREIAAQEAIACAQIAAASVSRRVEDRADRSMYLIGLAEGARIAVEAIWTRVDILRGNL